jgi:autotransporter family porin
MMMLRRLSLIVAATVAVPMIVASVRQTPVEASATIDSPVRVLDTRSGLGADRGPIERGEVLTLRIPGLVVSGETVALLNLTSVGATQPGNVSAWPCGSTKPDTSVLNFEPGRAVPNMVALEYTSAGLCFEATSSVHLLADLTGVTTGGELHGIRPRRLIDTRQSTPYRAGREYRVPIGGTPGIPSYAVGAAVNVTVVAPSRPGNLIVKPCGSSSDASTLNYLAGEVVPHFTFTKLSSGDLCITSTADANVIVDSFGWTGSGSDLRMITPDRLLDTRTGKGGTLGAVRDGQLVRLRIAGESGVPNDAVGATVNIVAVGGAAPGFVAAWPCHVSQPVVSTINLWPGVMRANQATLQLSPSGELCLRAKIVGSSRLHLVVDAVGYIDGEVDRQPPPDTTVPPPPDPTVPPPPDPTVPPTTDPPQTGRFETLPPGATLPSGVECAERVRPAAEIRPENSAANANRGSRANANNRTDWSEFDRVDGDFAGTTDEIIQWAACKWGIDEDIARAQVIKESYWYQSTNGDNGESWGLGQVRDTAHQSAFEYSINARNSSAYNLDYTYSSWRACYEGVYTWLNNTSERNGTYGAGDVWGCVGVWFSGRWYYNNDAYLNQPGDSVRFHYDNRTWETTWFING